MPSSVSWRMSVQVFHGIVSPYIIRWSWKEIMLVVTDRMLFQHVSPIIMLLQKDKILFQCHVIHDSPMAYMLQKDRMLVRVLVECYRSVSLTDRLTKLGFILLEGR